MRKYLPAPEYFLGKVLPAFPKHTIVEKVGSGSNGHVYRAHADEIEGDLAFKFVPIDNLSVDSVQSGTYLAEAKKANILENDSVVRCVDVLTWNDTALESSPFLVETLHGSRLVTQPSSSISSTSSPQSSALA